MKVSVLRKKILEKINQLPDDKLNEIFEYLSDMNFNKENNNSHKILKLAGSWKDMSEKEFKDFLDEIQNRRRNAFLSRRTRESSFD